MSKRLRSLAFAAPFALATVFAAPSADAFCGFYVAGADQKLFNNATTVVMMREGTRTVLSMQNNYQGPPENFAMVVPVPVVLQQENVKTLPTDVFDKVDKLASPRLVEYWEQDPCAPIEVETKKKGGYPRLRSVNVEVRGAAMDDLGVTVEAQFSVGEYEVVILSARDSAGLNTWLKQEKYKIPDGSEPLLRPYVQGGAKFFVAKVDVKKVRFENGQAMLSPLRFHYDSETFALPVRLGLVNSAGTQDLIVHILARGKRYETANYPNVAIPTNLDVKDAVRNDFGAFYAALFDRTLSRQPKAVVTEYAWDAGTCDPCPGPTLNGNDLMTLGMDALAGATEDGTPAAPNALSMKRRRPWPGGSGFVLTRLHLRYGKEGLGEDLVFRQAPPIVGGREFLTDGKQLETGAVSSTINNFQGRYAIRHAWTGPVACANPRRGIWGGPPGGIPSKGIEAARNLA
ncbi:MAG TPA: DUF2330 domain-containing protein, partial [Polyangium sp.]|nr:DUF2330 domain-containing protein [Polyangium sp.]